MTHLHTGDCGARRLEFGAFAGLALSGIMLIAIAASDAARFASHDDELAQALSLDARGMAQVAPARGTKQQATNFSVIHASANVEVSCCPL